MAINATGYCWDGIDQLRSWCGTLSFSIYLSCTVCLSLFALSVLCLALSLIPSDDREHIFSPRVKRTALNPLRLLMARTAWGREGGMAAENSCSLWYLFQHEWILQSKHTRNTQVHAVSLFREVSFLRWLRSEHITLQTDPAAVNARAEASFSNGGA